MQLSRNPAEAFQLGNTCLARGEPEAAIAAFQTCLALAPDHPDTLYNLATAQLQAGQTVEGAQTLVQCLHHAPAFGAAHVNLATALTRLGLLDEARNFAEIAVHLLPESAEPLLCLGCIQHQAGAYEDAVATYRRAAARAPGHAAGLSSLANALHALGRMDEALAVHDRAVAAAPPDGPDHAACRLNRAMTLLAMEDFAAGWAEHEWRGRQADRPPRFPTPPWRGQALQGRRILLHSEQGLGDTLQFARYAPLVAARGGIVTLQVQRPLVRLLARAFGLPVLARDEPTPPFDVHCPLMSLPLAFATRPATVPAPAPLAADPASVAAWETFWAAATPRGSGLRVGLVWAGGQHQDSWEGRLLDRRRSLQPADLEGLADVPGVTFISLQKEIVPPGCPPMVDVMSRMTDFADTAALVATLDLVISVDTSVAHLAGGMGRPVWLLSRYHGCWRWPRDRETSRWYPTMRLYHQRRPGDWPDVVARLRRDLLHHARERPPEHRQGVP